MFGIGIIELVIALLLLGSLGYLVGRLLTGARRRVALPAAAPGWTMVLLARLIALVVGVVAAVLLWSRDPGHGRGPMLSLAVLGLCVLVGTAIGETVVRPAPTPGPRRASTTPRRVADYLPRSTHGVVASGVALVVLLVVTTATASPDADGRHRELRCQSATITNSHGPYAGAYYSGPLAVMLLVVLATAALAARRVVDRPRGLAGSDADDDLLRRSSLDVVVAATGLAVTAPLTGVLLTTGSALAGISSAQPSCAPGWWGWTGGLLLVASLVSLAVTLLFLGRLLGPARVPQALFERSGA